MSDVGYRLRVYEQRMQEWLAAKAQLADVYKSPYYGSGWRVD